MNSSDLKKLVPIDEILPSELISRILELTVLENIGPGSISVDSSVLVFGMVSKRWRDITHSNPALWTTLSLNVNQATTIPRLVSGVRTWLLRAGILPLSVRLTVSCSYIASQLALLTKAVLSFSPQIRRLFIQVMFKPLDHSTQSAPGTSNYIILGKGGFPILETLGVDCPFDHSSEAVLANVLASAPALTNFSVMRYLGTISALPVPMAQLTRLVWGSQELIATIRDVLSRAPKLEECRFVFARVTTPVPSPSEITIHNRLQHLHIGPWGFEQFLDGLILPALTHLTFDGTTLNSLQPSPPWPQRDVIAFLRRSQCVLEQLSFLKINMAPQELEACVEMVSPMLKVLCVDGGSDGLVGATLLARLTVPAADEESRDVLCPLLERIRMHGGVLGQDKSGSGILDMLESRFYYDGGGMDGVVRLKSVLIGGTFGPRQRKRVERLKEAGLDPSFIPEGNRLR